MPRRRPLSRRSPEPKRPRASRVIRVRQVDIDARILALAEQGLGARLIARDLAGPDFWGVLSRRGVADRLRVLRAKGAAGSTSTGSSATSSPSGSSATGAEASRGSEGTARALPSSTSATSPASA